MTTASGRIARIAATVSRIRRKQSRGVRQHLGEARDGQFGQRHQRLHALFPHLLAADPGDPQPRAGALAQRADQRRAERVARRLAGDDEDERRGVAGGHARTLRHRRTR